jgi:hypothetical protein
MKSYALSHVRKKTESIDKKNVIGLLGVFNLNIKDNLSRAKYHKVDEWYFG